MKPFNYLAVCGLTTLLLYSCGPSLEEKSKQEVLQDMIFQPGYVSTVESAEEFSKIKEEGFLAVKTNPYSTFSIDVDNASYSIMRRMLLDGNLPPKEEVRIEEWINYFSYTYPQPQNNDPFSISTELSDCPWNKNHKLFHVGLKGKEISEAELKPSNLVFLLDVSGSMADADKLPLLQKALRLLLPKLKSHDKISLVVYAGAAGVVLDAEDGDAQEKISAALENLQAGGSTAGGEGIELAYKLAEDNFIKKGNNRVILATDGDFNVGVSSESELEELIAAKRDKGIYLSVLGFGSGNIKDNKMETLADKGNGNYYYIDNILEARKVLVEQFGGTLSTIAKDVKIQMEFNPKFIKEYRLIGYENRRLANEDFNNDKKDAGELGSGHTVTALYELVPAASNETNAKVDAPKYQNTQSGDLNTTELANIKFRYKNPGKTDTVSRLITKPVVASYVPFDKVSTNYLLTAAVTEFGLLMRESEFKADASFESALKLAQAAKGEDKEGYVAELVRLIKTAESLKQSTVKK